MWAYFLRSTPYKAGVLLKNHNIKERRGGDKEGREGEGREKEKEGERKGKGRPSKARLQMSIWPLNP